MGISKLTLKKKKKLCQSLFNYYLLFQEFRASLVVQSIKNPPAVQKSAFNARDPGSVHGSGRSPGEVNGNPLQYSCQENSMDRGA